MLKYLIALLLSILYFTYKMEVIELDDNEINSGKKHDVSRLWSTIVSERSKIQVFLVQLPGLQL